MKHPSIRFRLLLGTGLILAAMLTLACVAVYRMFERSMSDEIEEQLTEKTLLLAKSSELETIGLVYEWKEAMNSPGAPDPKGLFVLWDVGSNRETKSPELGTNSLPVFHGKLNEPVMRDITLWDGRPAKAVGLLHYPFVNEATAAFGMQNNVTFHPENFPQVVVCAREVQTLQHKLMHVRAQLIRAAVAMLLITWGAIMWITTRCLRPIRDLSGVLAMRHEHPDQRSAIEIPAKLPSELLGLAESFNTAFTELERSRNREKEFVLHAAHELRTPVAGIMSTLEQAVMRPRDSEELANRIRRALGITTSMRLTLDSLMRLARLRGGLQSGQKLSFEPIALVREMIGALEAEAVNRGLVLQVELPTEDIPMLNDPGLFRVLISNLADNAIHHCPGGGKVSFHVESSPFRFVFISRNQKGDLGDADLARIFEPFQRGGRVGGQSEGHAGLGLSLAREAAHLLGGRLHAEIDGECVVFIATLLR
jgi:signal transduction histidine kinase